MKDHGRIAIMLAVSRRAAPVPVDTVMSIAVGVIIGVHPVHPAAMETAVPRTIAMNVWMASVWFAVAGQAKLVAMAVVAFVMQHGIYHKKMFLVLLVQAFMVAMERQFRLYPIPGGVLPGKVSLVFAIIQQQPGKT